MARSDDRDKSAHDAEMRKRRETALEREESGPVFPTGCGAYDGRYCWTVVDQSFYDKVLRSLSWFTDNVPGIRTDRIGQIPGEEKPIIFRLRGFQPAELPGLVESQMVIIGEYWPNAFNEEYRGITFVIPDQRKWHQDLVPKTDRVFRLSLGKAGLTLESQGRAASDVPLE